MAGDADLAAVGALLSDRTRARILLTLLNGGMTSASALAARADVSRPLASAHLRKLTEGGLITVEPHGRHRFYRLSSQRVADALESLILLSPATAVTSLRGSKQSIRLQRGRLRSPRACAGGRASACSAAASVTTTSPAASASPLPSG